MTDRELAYIRRQNELLQLDLEWDREARRLGGPVRGSAGAYRSVAVGTGAVTITLGLILSGLGLWAPEDAVKHPELAPFLVASGLVLASFGAAAGAFLWQRAISYEKARARYQRRRTTLLGEMRPAGPQRSLRSATTKAKAGGRVRRRRRR